MRWPLCVFSMHNACIITTNHSIFCMINGNFVANIVVNGSLLRSLSMLFSFRCLIFRFVWCYCHPCCYNHFNRKCAYEYFILGTYSYLILHSVPVGLFSIQCMAYTHTQTLSLSISFFVFFFLSSYSIAWQQHFRQQSIWCWFVVWCMVAPFRSTTTKCLLVLR